MRASRSEDPYEAHYMPGEGGVLYRDKIVAPKWFLALMSLPLLIIVAVTIFESLKAGAVNALPLIISTPIIAMMWLLFSVLRITVSREQLVVQYGLIGPKVDIKDIISADAVDYDWKRFGGWGIRIGIDGSWAYNMMGDGGQAVRVVYRDGTRQHTIYVSTRHPAVLADAINQAMRGGAASEEVIFDSASAEGEVVLGVGEEAASRRKP